MRKAQTNRDGRVWEKTRTTNLYWHRPYKKYYMRARMFGKIISRSLETDVLSIARLKLPDRLKEERQRLQKVKQGGNPAITLGEAADIYRRRINLSTEHKTKAKDFHAQRLIALEKTWDGFKGQRIAKITSDDCLEWAADHAKHYSPSPYNQDLGILRKLIDIGIESGARLDNPAKKLPRQRVPLKELNLPSPDQFQKLIVELENGGGRFSKGSAELVQFLAFSGCRKGEARWVCWGDCDLEKKILTLRGDPEEGLKNRKPGEIRKVPITPDLEVLLKRMRAERAGEPETALVLKTNECQKSLNRACAKIGIKRLVHHDLRHLFATQCIESGVDIPTVSRWLGHKDGGALAMRVYGHLREKHSAEMANKVSFKPKGAQ